MVNVLKEKLEANKEAWYILSVSFGKESDVKKRLLLNKNLSLKEVIAPEPIKDVDIYQYFLGYAFVKLFMDIDKYVEILETENVYRFLGGVLSITKKLHTYIPYKASEKEMDNVRDYLTGVRKLDDKKELRVYDRVIITKGDLSSIKGKILEIKKGYVKVLPEAFFQNVIIVPTASVARCK